jgi:hypothetical protein
MAAKISKKTQSRSKEKRNRLPKAKIGFTLPNDIPIWAPFLIFILADLIFFSEQIWGKMHFWATFMSDFNELHIPFQYFIQQSLKSGQLPFWNPYTFSGMPFLADIQVGFFYPLNLVLSFLNSHSGLPVKAMEIHIILHFFIAQLSMYFLLRYLKISRTGSVIAALSYSLSAALVARIVIQTFIYQFSWLPLLFMLFHKTVTLLKWKYAVITGLVLGLTMLVGHPQGIFYNLLFIGLFLLWQGAAQIASKEIQGKQIMRFAALALLPFIIALGVSAIQVLHTMELADLSKRTLLTYKEAADGSLHIKQLLSMISPKVFGFTDMSPEKHAPFYLALRKGYHFWETAFYFGIGALILGLIGIFRNYKSRLAIFLLFIAAFGFLHALGSNGFLFKILFYLPGFDKFRFPSRTVYYIALTFSIFAGFGFDVLFKQREKIPFSTLAVAVGVPLIFAAGIFSGIAPLAAGAPESFMAEIQGYGLTALFFILAIGGVIFLRYKNKIPAFIAGLLLIILVITDLTTNLSGFKNHKLSPEKVFKIHPNLSTLLKPDFPKNIFRVKMRNKHALPFRRNSGMVSGMMLVEGFNALQLLRKFPPVQWKNLLSVGYQIKTDPQNGQSYFSKVEDSFPHSRMTYKSISASPENVVADMKSKNIDFINETLLEKKIPFQLPQKNVAEVENSVICKTYENNYQKYEVNSAENGLLNVSEIWYPAWKVKLNGQPAELFRINYCLRGVAIPAGSHTVEMYYDSDAFNLGKWVTIFTLLASAAFLFYDRKTRLAG